MEYKLSSFQFSQNVSREDKHQVIKRINSVRSRCPSDSNFTGQFSIDGNIFKGEVKVLFSKGSFFVESSAANINELLTSLINLLDDQISCWKSVRFDQPQTFIDYSDFEKKTVSGA